ncbi:integrin alpha-PS3-like isoform X2 [Leguminivora glycinivorella]|uniref:integrin alpha-PS3-like isoform X2 n=1 Tax=Leguminivora glycinivorella TaxID=1035111 RepID=UPI002010771D|nr:integrin alpha-PS3-like isoform X2 [Leguminivora glycinivorella]
MPQIKTCVLLSVFLFSSCDCGDVFHGGSKIVFYPSYPAEYFGYAVAIGESGLLVGAPKASTIGLKKISAGVVFNCPLKNLQATSTNVSCTPLKIKGSNSLRNGMWFGASLAVGPTGKTVICALRLARIHEYDYGTTKKVDVNGACYLKMKRRESFLFPLDNYDKQWFQINNSRTEYVDYHMNATMTSIKYYTLAQAGMAVKVTEDRIIIGAPGLLVWSGGIVQYAYNPAESSISYSQQATFNPYFTFDVRPDEYYGYSVESGVFEDGGKTLYVVGGPKAKKGFGMVLVLEPASTEMAPLKILAKLKGPQLGAYFGASLCCVDINANDRMDLLVGAPNYVKQFYKEDFYDQGAVFVYLNKEQATGFVLEYTGHVTGSKSNGAKFGYSMADLGDIDGDGYNDMAVSAPWEDEGAGVVYLYRGHIKGLRTHYEQRIVASEARGFGMGLTKGYDVDHNNCNDLVIGAYKTDAVYMYRCIPTVKVEATIKVPEALNMPQNTTNFTAEFCVKVQPLKDYRTVIKMEFIASVTIDPEEKRAMIAGNSTHLYTVLATPLSDNCAIKLVEIEPTADLSRPIRIIFDMEPIDRMQVNVTEFKMDAGRVSEDSNLHSSLNLQLEKECGKDLVCSPWLEMKLEPFNEPYIPGSGGRLGAIVRVVSKEEPAFGVRVNLTLPSLPKRVPTTCFLEGFILSCNLPSPFYRNQSAVWEVEVEYTNDLRDMGVAMIEASIDDPVTSRNISDHSSQYLEISIITVTNISATGKALPNATLAVSRENLDEGGSVPIIHYFQVSLASKEIADCEESWDSTVWSWRALGL